jgi:hypothetical protein
MYHALTLLSGKSRDKWGIECWLPRRRVDPLGATLLAAVRDRGLSVQKKRREKPPAFFIGL